MTEFKMESSQKIENLRNNLLSVKSTRELCLIMKNKLEDWFYNIQHSDLGGIMINIYSNHTIIFIIALIVIACILLPIIIIATVLIINIAICIFLLTMVEATVLLSSAAALGFLLILSLTMIIIIGISTTTLYFGSCWFIEKLDSIKCYFVDDTTKNS